MSNKLIMSLLCVVVASVGSASSVLQAQAVGDPIRTDCRGEATYTSTSIGVPFDVSFDLALRDQDGEDLGWAFARTSATAGGPGFDPGYNAAARIRSVEFHEDIAVFVSVWARGTSGALGQILGLGTNDITGVASIIGLRDGAALNLTDQTSEAFFWPPDQVPANPNDLLDAEALDDFGEPFEGFEGWTVRQYILQQLAGSQGNDIHPGGDIQITGAR